MMDERTEGRTHGRTLATLNALPHSTNGGGIKIDFSETIAACDLKVGRCRQLINKFMKVCE